MIRLAGHLYAPEDRGPAVVTIDDGSLASIDLLGPLKSDHAWPGLPAGTIGGPGHRILPGLVDVQVNGAFGQDFADPAADIELVRRRLPELGVTAFVPTIVTSPAGAYAPALANLGGGGRGSAPPGQARMLGVHIEGPFLSPNRPGTHDRAWLRLPSQAEAAGWLEAGPVRWVTLAPELPGALELTAWLVERGVRVSMGHTDATWAEAEAADRGGASLVTHLFNAMRPMRHRDPGVAAYALASSLPVGLVADGVHVAFDMLRVVARTKAPDELFVVTDALAGLGLPPGRHALAGRDYVSDGSVGRLEDGTLSGSLLPLHLSVRNLVEQVRLPVSLAVRMATVNPARAVGLDPMVGRIARGGPADVVLLDSEWRIAATVAGGVLAYEGGVAA